MIGPVASLAVKVLHAFLPADAAARAARRIFRRELFLLSNVSQRAAGIAKLDAQIEKVWGVEIDSQTRRTLDRIAHLNADPLVTVGGA